MSFNFSKELNEQKTVKSLSSLTHSSLSTSVTGNIFPKLHNALKNQFELLNSTKAAEKARQISNISLELDILFDEDITVEGLQNAILGTKTKSSESSLVSLLKAKNNNLALPTAG